MKNFLLTAVIAASAAMPVMAGTALPYSETFDRRRFCDDDRRRCEQRQQDVVSQ